MIGVEAFVLCLTDLATRLTNHRDATGIETYFVSMGDTLDAPDIETLAIGGGARPHSDTCTNTNSPCRQYGVGTAPLASTIEAAMGAIHTAAEKCHYAFPSGASPASLEVTYSTGGAPQSMSKVANASLCTASPGYYYNNNANPSEIHLCPSACDLAPAEPAATIETVQQCN